MPRRGYGGVGGVGGGYGAVAAALVVGLVVAGVALAAGRLRRGDERAMRTVTVTVMPTTTPTTRAEAAAAGTAYAPTTLSSVKLIVAVDARRGEEQTLELARNTWMPRKDTPGSDRVFVDIRRGRALDTTAVDDDTTLHALLRAVKRFPAEDWFLLVRPHMYVLPHRVDALAATASVDPLSPVFLAYDADTADDAALVSAALARVAAEKCSSPQRLFACLVDKCHAKLIPTPAGLFPFTVQAAATRFLAKTCTAMTATRCVSPATAVVRGLRPSNESIPGPWDFSPHAEYWALHAAIHRIKFARTPTPAMKAAARSTVILVETARDADVTSTHVATWVPHALELGFRVAWVGDCAACSYSLGPDVESHAWLSVKTRAMLRDALTRFPTATYFFKMDVDTFLLPENLAAYLASRSSAATPILEGHWIQHRHNKWFVHGGAGYVVNRAALVAAKATEGFPACPPDYPEEDLDLSVCLSLTANVPRTLVSELDFRSLVWIISRASHLRVRPGLITTHALKQPNEYVAVDLMVRELSSDR